MYSVLTETKWYLVMIRFLICVPHLTFFWVCQILWFVVFKHLRQKRHLWNMFPTKSRGQNDRMGRPVTSCVHQNLHFSIRFVTKISISPPPPFWLAAFWVSGWIVNAVLADKASGWLSCYRPAHLWLTGCKLVFVWLLRVASINSRQNMFWTCV